MKNMRYAKFLFFSIKPLAGWIFSFSIIFVGSGCVTTGTDGVVDMGGGLYMVGGLGGAFDHSGSAVKVKYLKMAKEYCEAKQMNMIPVETSARDAGLQHASAEVQFRCVTK